MFNRCSDLDFNRGHIKVGFAYTDSGIPYLNENLSYRLSSCYTEPSNPSPLWLIQPICKGRKSSKSWWTTSAGALALLKGPGEPPKAIRIAFHQTGLLWLNLVGANQILKCSPKKSTEDLRNYGGKRESLLSILKAFWLLVTSYISPLEACEFNDFWPEKVVDQLPTANSLFMDGIWKKLGALWHEVIKLILHCP